MSGTSDEFAGGKFPARVAVCNEELCFISRASLTGHAMAKNMEADILIRGGDSPTWKWSILELCLREREIPQGPSGVPAGFGEGVWCTARSRASSSATRASAATSSFVFFSTRSSISSEDGRGRPVIGS